MDFGAWILLIEFFIFVLAIPAAYVVIKRLTEETKTSDTLVIVRDGGKTGQRVIGNLISKQTGKNGRQIIKFLSRDSIKPEVVTIIAEPNKVIAHPKGVWSSDRNIIEILPNSAQDYFNNLLNDIEIKGAETHIVKAQREGINRQASHLADIGEGEISDTNLGLIKDFENKLLRSQVKDTQKSGGYVNPDTFKA